MSPTAEIADPLTDVDTDRALAQHTTTTASGEKMPVIENELSGEARTSTHQDQLTALHAQLIALRESDPALTFAEAATKAGVPLSRARSAVPSIERRAFGVRRNVEATYSHEQIFADLRRAAGLTDNGVLSRQKYDKIRSEVEGGEDMISGVRVLQVFGSWAAACAAAKVRAGSTNRLNYSRNWNEADLLNWVVRFMSEHGQSCTYEQLATWLGEQDGAPSAPTLRIRLGRWSTIRAKAIQQMAAA